MSNKRVPLHNLPQLPILNSRVFDLAKGGEKGAHFTANVFLFSNDKKVSSRNRSTPHYFYNIFPILDNRINKEYFIAENQISVLLL